MLEPLDRRDLMEALTAIPDLLEDLDVTLVRGYRVGPLKAGGPPVTTRARVLPFRVDASRAKTVLESVLRTYALRVGHFVNVSPPHQPARRAKFLHRHLPGVPDDAPNLDGITVITVAVDDVRVVIDRPEEMMCVGSCWDCDAYLYATRDQTIVECGHCGQSWNAVDLRTRLLEQADDLLATAPQLAKLLPWFAGKPVKAATIRKWGERGKLTTVPTLEGRKLYRLGEVLNLLIDSQK